MCGRVIGYYAELRLSPGTQVRRFRFGASKESVDSRRPSGVRSAFYTISVTDLSLMLWGSCELALRFRFGFREVSRVYKLFIGE